MYCRDNLESTERMQRYACLQTETRIHRLVIRDADRRTYIEGALLNDNADVPIPSIVLRTEHLSRSVNGRLIVNDVSFEVDQGDILAVVGPSGAGKSSLLRLLNRLDEPTSGTYFVEGREFRDFAPRELRRRVGMVMQSAYLFSGSVADNLRFGPRQRGENLSDAVVSDLVAEVGLPDFASPGFGDFFSLPIHRLELHDAKSQTNRLWGGRIQNDPAGRWAHSHYL